MSVRLPEIRPRELERVVLRLGYRPARSRGSHRIYNHPSDPERQSLLAPNMAAHGVSLAIDLINELFDGNRPASDASPVAI